MGQPRAGLRAYDLFWCEKAGDPLDYRAARGIGRVLPRRDGNRGEPVQPPGSWKRCIPHRGHQDAAEHRRRSRAGRQRELSRRVPALWRHPGRHLTRRGPAASPAYAGTRTIRTTARSRTAPSRGRAACRRGAPGCGRSNRPFASTASLGMLARMHCPKARTAGATSAGLRTAMSSWPSDGPKRSSTRASQWRPLWIFPGTVASRMAVGMVLLPHGEGTAC
jgi:hypothetical protein